MSARALASVEYLSHILPVLPGPALCQFGHMFLDVIYSLGVLLCSHPHPQRFVQLEREPVVGLILEHSQWASETGFGSLTTLSYQ